MSMIKRSKISLPDSVKRLEAEQPELRGSFDCFLKQWNKFEGTQKQIEPESSKRKYSSYRYVYRGENESY